MYVHKTLMCIPPWYGMYNIRTYPYLTYYRKQVEKKYSKMQLGQYLFYMLKAKYIYNITVKPLKKISSV